jgi:hypothetical protein
MEYLESCGQRVESFIRSSDQFQNSCTTAFETVDARGVGKVSVSQAATACVFFFKVCRSKSRCKCIEVVSITVQSSLMNALH